MVTESNHNDWSLMQHNNESWTISTREQVKYKRENITIEVATAFGMP